MFYYAQQLQRSAQMNAVLTRVCWIIKCPFTARTHISDFQPSLCRLLTASLLQNASHPSGDSLLKGCSQPVGSAGGNNHSAGHNHAAACPAPPPDVRKPQALASNLNCHTLPNLLQPRNRGKAPTPICWSGMGALQRIHGVEGSQQQCFKEPKLDALDDLRRSPALAWQLYFWLNCIFWFANVRSGNTSGETWPQLRKRSFATHFPWGQHFAH